MELIDEFAAMRRAAPDLERLERYERRAWSRRKRAISSFMDILAKEQTFWPALQPTGEANLTAI